MSEADDAALTNALDGATSRRRRPARGDKDYLPPHVRNVLRELAVTSGLAPDCRPYLVRRMRYYLGAGPAPTAPSQLRGELTEWADQRARELLDANHRRLPPIDHAAMR